MSLRSDSAAALGLAACAGALRLRPLGSTDLGWHLSSGRAVVELGARTYDDPLTVEATSQFTNNSWLFDAFAWLLWSVTGPAGLAVLAGLCMSATTLILWRIAADSLGPTGRWRAVALAALATGVASVRFFPRPHLFFLLCLAASIWMTRSALRAQGRRQLAWGAALCAVVALWAQCHLSVVIAPVVVLLSLDRRPDPRLIALFPAVALLPFTGAEGLGLLDQAFGFTGGDAAISQHETQPMQWAWLIPPDGPELLLAELLLAVAVLGSIRSRRLPLLPLGLAVLGIYLTVNTHRFVGAAAILALPWAAEGWRAPRPARSDRWVAALACAACLYSTGSGWSPGLGLHRATIPVDLLAAADALELSGPGFTNSDLGGWMGFERYGQARVYIDARTITFHEDTRYFAQRAALEDPSAFALLDATYGFAWVALPRRAATCGSLSASSAWSAVWMDDKWSLFVRGEDPRALRAVEPCSSDRALLASCRAAAAPAAHRADLDRILQAVPSAAWASRSAAQLSSSCGPPDTEAALRHLETARVAEPDHQDLAWIGGQVFAAAERPEAALAWLATAPRDDARAQAARAGMLLEQGRPEEARQVAQELVDRIVDATPPPLRAVLATACLQTGELRCAAEQALRGALLGDPASIQLLATPEVESQLTDEQLRLARSASER